LKKRASANFRKTLPILWTEKNKWNILEDNGTTGRIMRPVCDQCREEKDEII